MAGIPEGDDPLSPLTRRVLEAVAAAMGLDQGREQLTLEFDDGRLRRWGRTDPGNGALELARFDEVLRAELDGVMGAS